MDFHNEPDHSSGRPRRENLRLVCELRQGHRPWQVTELYNLSEAGFCMEWQPGLDLERPVWIRIPGLTLLEAEIRWRQQRVAGCRFAKPLYGPVFEHIVARARGETE